MTGVRGRGDAGLTLIELVVTVAIMGTAFSVLVGGLGAAVVGSDLQRQQAAVATLLRSFAESVKGAPYADPAGRCAAPSDYGGSFPVPAGYRVTVTRVEFAPSPFNAFLADCRTGLSQPTAHEPTAFSNPINAYVIGEAPEPQTADATLRAAILPSASITLAGFRPRPAGSVGTLSVVHREGEGTATPQLTVTGGSVVGSLRRCPALCEDRLDLTVTGELAATFEVSLAVGAVTGDAALDGIWLEVPGSGADPGLQRIELRVEAESRRVVRDLQVVKRR